MHDLNSLFNPCHPVRFPLRSRIYLTVIKRMLTVNNLPLFAACQLWIFPGYIVLFLHSTLSLSLPLIIAHLKHGLQQREKSCLGYCGPLQDKTKLNKPLTLASSAMACNAAL